MDATTKNFNKNSANIKVKIIYIFYEHQSNCVFHEPNHLHFSLLQKTREFVIIYFMNKTIFRGHSDLNINNVTIAIDLQSP